MTDFVLYTTLAIISVYARLSNPTPHVEQIGGYLLDESGDFLVTEDGQKIII